MTSRHFDLSVAANLAIDRGATFRRIFKWANKATGTAYDLTGAQVKFEAFDGETNTRLIDAGTDNGKVELDGPRGKMILSLQRIDTLNLPDILYYYLTVFLTNGDAKRLLRGNLECVGLRGAIDPAVLP